VKAVSFVAALVLAWYVYHRVNAPITYPPGVLIAAEPVQVDAAPNLPAFDYGQFQLKPLARFALDARVLHRKIYRYDRLQISQAARFFYYEYQGQPPIPREEIISHATNLHLIPSTKALAGQCRSLRTGELVHLSGLLVEATGGATGTWRSSLSRTDTGNGACELVWVEELSQLSR
jgi:hypothetical protein